MKNKRYTDLTWDKLKALIENTYKPHGSYYSLPFLVGTPDDMQIRWFYYEAALRGNHWDIELTSVITLNEHNRCSIRLNPKLDEPISLSHPATLCYQDKLYQDLIDMFTADKFDEAKKMLSDKQDPELKSLYKSLESKYLF